MSATVISLAHEVESRHWDDVVEGDRLMAMDYVQRARGIAAAWACARSQGREEFVSCEVAAALSVDDRTAQLLVAEARLLVELPAILDAMVEGRLRLQHAKVLISELLPIDTAIAVDVLDVVLPKVGDRTPEQVRGIVRRAIIRIDGDAAARRRREAVRGRRVFTSPEPDGMALFGAYLPAADALEAHRLVDDRARSYDRDDRTVDQRRADAVMDLIRCNSGVAPATGRRNVDVVVPVTVALGFADEPADLVGYGPIDAEAARELLTDAALRKVCVDALTGEVLAVAASTVTPATGDLRRALLEMVLTATPYDDVHTDAYRPTTGQRRTVERRDRTCTFPACTAPAHRCDLDHHRPWPRGTTSTGNLSAVSRKHHRAKQAGWTPGPGPHGSTNWVSPAAGPTAAPTHTSHPSPSIRARSSAHGPPDSGMSQKSTHISVPFALAGACPGMGRSVTSRCWVWALLAMLCVACQPDGVTPKDVPPPDQAQSAVPSAPARSQEVPRTAAGPSAEQLASPGALLLTAAPGGDGDSWKDTAGVRYRLGLINAPELSECYGQIASNKRKQLTAKGFRASSYAVDRFGRRVSVVTLPDGRNLNVELARHGYANDKYLQQFRHEKPALASQLDVAFAAARRNHEGLWRACRASPSPAAAQGFAATSRGSCDSSYPDVCIPPPPPDLDCGDISFRRFRVLAPDPHHFDLDRDGIGCETG